MLDIIRVFHIRNNYMKIMSLWQSLRPTKKNITVVAIFYCVILPPSFFEIFLCLTYQKVNLISSSQGTLTDLIYMHFIIGSVLVVMISWLMYIHFMIGLVLFVMIFFGFYSLILFSGSFLVLSLIYIFTVSQSKRLVKHHLCE